MTDIAILSGVTSNNIRVPAGTNVYVKAGGTISAGIIDPGGHISLEVDGNQRGDVVVSSGGQYDVNGNLYGRVSCMAGGLTIFWSQTVQYKTAGVVLNGGGLIAYTEPNIVYTAAGGNVTFASGCVTTIAQNTVAGHTTLDVKPGATVFGVNLMSGNILNVSAGGSVSGLLEVWTGGTVNFGGNLLAKANVYTGANFVLQKGAVQYSGAGLRLFGGEITAYTDPNVVFTSNGGNITFESGCRTSIAQNTVAGATTVHVAAGATITGANVQSGNVFNVDFGGTVSGSLEILSGGTVNMGGNTYASTNIYTGAVLNLLDGSSQYTGNYQRLSGGTINAYREPNLTFTAAGGLLNLYNTTSTEALTLLTAGATTISAIGNTSLTGGGTLQSGNKVYIGSASLVSGTVSVMSGSYLSMGGTIAGKILLSDGGTMVVGPQAGGVISMLGSTNCGLTISGLAAGGTLTTQITDFNGSGKGNSDAIKIAGVRSADVKSVSYPDADHVTLTLKNGSVITLNIVGAKAAGYSLSDSAEGSLMYETCFLAGNMIATPEGMRAIETLVVGDYVNVLDAQGGQSTTRAIIWAGQKTVHTQSSTVATDAVSRGAYPVRILKDAFSPNIPSQDMLITPEHCLCLDGRLIPARMLVNDRTIFYDRSFESYTYYHIETEDHCLIWANNVLTETYLDTGNRTMFDDAPIMFSSQAHGKLAAPLEVSIDFVQPLYQAILDRAVAQGVPARQPDPVLTSDPGLYLLTDRGTVLENRSVNPGVAKFALPSGVHSVRLVSRNARPSDTIGPFVDDRRCLGVLVGAVTLFASQTAVDITTHLEQDLPGWHASEHGPVRWTNGFAFLPLPENSVTHGSSLAIEVRAVTVYRLEEDEPAALSA